MIRGVYSVRDEASGLYMGLQLNETDEVASRSFDFALDSNQLMQFRPDDFSLWRVGYWDDVKGAIEICDPYLMKRGVKRGKK